MYNLKISFNNPYFLFLIIISFAFVVYLYLKQAKKYRFNRNNILSKVLGLLSMICAVLVMSGVAISYSDVDVTNEVIILVDLSYSSTKEKKIIDEYVFEAIESHDSSCKLGVVTFGKTQIYASSLSFETNTMYYDYMTSETPDNSGSDISSALDYSNSLFTNSNIGKILLITDGIQTDGDALNKAKSLSLLGVIIDVITYSTLEVEDDVFPIQLNNKNANVSSNEATLLEVVLNSTIETDGIISIYDNGELKTNIYTKVNKGSNTLTFEHEFIGNGLHELKIEIDFSNDKNNLNNVLYSYVFINSFDKILILQRENEADIFSTKIDDEINIDIMNINDITIDVNELRKYDQIILMNIANADMKVGFIQILYAYVNDFGGSVLTIGGVKEEFGETVANVYNREDMSGTLYESMLPINAVDYIPPIAIMLVIDSSSSMSDSIQGAKESAIACLDSLDDRDYVGIITYSDKETLVLAPTPMTNRSTIVNAIYSITTTAGATVYSGALKQAGTSLKAINYVNTKHIILVSDGQPGDSANEYLSIVTDNLKGNITTSVIAFGTSSYVMEEVSIYGNGYYYTATDQASLTQALKQDLSMPEIREFVYERFQPEFGTNSYIFQGVTQEEMPYLEGFFGTKIKTSANNILKGEYGQPIYASWSLGRGSVGSFMCDLNGYWSSEFLADSSASIVINAIINSIAPVNKVDLSDIVVSAFQDNFYLDLTINTSISSGDYINVIVTNPISSTNLQTVYEIDDFSGLKTIRLLLDEAGVYEIEIIKYDKYGTEISNYILYQEFSYSLEYNQTYQNQDNTDFITNLVEYGNGSLLEDSSLVYDNLQSSFTNVIDLSVILCSVIIVLLLCDVVVRKFKIVFPWEKNKDRRV